MAKSKYRGFWHELKMSMSPKYRDRVVREIAEAHAREDGREAYREQEDRNEYAGRVIRQYDSQSWDDYGKRNKSVQTNDRFRDGDIYTTNSVSQNISVDSKKIDQLSRDLGSVIKTGTSDEAEQAYRTARRILDPLKSDYRARNAIEQLETTFKRGHRRGGLDSTLSVLGFVGSAFFLSSNITGNTIANIGQASSNFLGVGLFLVGILGAGDYFFKRRSYSPSSSQEIYSSSKDEKNGRRSLYNDSEWAQVQLANSLITGYKANKGREGYLEDYNRGKKILEDVRAGKFRDKRR